MFSCCPPERPITKLYATLFKAVSLLQNQMPLSLLYWRAQRWIWSCPWVSLALGRAEGSPPMMCWQRLAQYSPGDAVGLCSKGTLLACLRVVVHQDPRVFFFFFLGKPVQKVADHTAAELAVCFEYWKNLLVLGVFLPLRLLVFGIHILDNEIIFKLN